MKQFSAKDTPFIKAVVLSTTMLLLSVGSSSGQGAHQPAPKTLAEKEQISKQKAEAILASIPGIHFSKGIPTNFPIATYNSNVVRTNFSNSTKGPPTAAAVIITRDKPDRVFQWYQDTCKRGNWALKIPTPKAMSVIGKQGKIYMLDADKQDQHLSVFCIVQQKTNNTLISISWSKKKQAFGPGGR